MADTDAPEPLEDQVRVDQETIGQTAELVQSMLDAGELSPEAAAKILDALRGSGLEIDATVPSGRIPGAEVGVAMIRAERLRQVAVEGYDAEHDLQHRCGELSAAAHAYALHAAGYSTTARYEWPFDGGFKPGPKPLDSLVKAGGLALAEAGRIAAEIDRIIAEEARHE